jgi:hypothetical protein
MLLVLLVKIDVTGFWASMNADRKKMVASSCVQLLYEFH